MITHYLPLDDAPRGFAMFRDEEDECVKVVLKPQPRFAPNIEPGARRS